jgi:LPXTG-site transpeptidase (sortase) family protein
MKVMARLAHLMGFVAAVAVLTGLLLIVLSAWSGDAPPPPEAGPDEPLAVASLVPTAAPTAVPTPEPTPASTAPVVHLAIPRVGIDANVVTLGVDPDGTMQAPNGPKDVAWYNFSARPGYLGNTVFSGHVDYANYGAAVFWRLRDLREGDEIVVTLADDVSLAYRVVSLTAYDEATAPIQEIVGPTETESITLITCTGTFNRSIREYDKRLVVRGERVPI